MRHSSRYFLMLLCAVALLSCLVAVRKGLEYQRVSGIPAGWSANLWQSCWHVQGGWVDFTVAAIPSRWENEGWKFLLTRLIFRV